MKPNDLTLHPLLNAQSVAVVGASDAEFVRRLKIFRKTGQKHVRFIADSVSRIEPALAADCQKIVEAHCETTAT